MKLVFDTMVCVENVAAVIAAHYAVWLQGLSHERSPGPEALLSAMSASFFCSLSALVLGVASLIAFRVLKNRLAIDLGFRKTWAVFSLCASAAIFLISLMPVEVG
jgi:hypothetical protein